MKYVFELDDIKAGMYVIRECSPKGSIDLDFAATVSFMIGYKYTLNETRYCWVSFLTDGMTSSALYSKEEILTELNAVGYRPLKYSEIIKILEWKNSKS